MNVMFKRVPLVCQCAQWFVLSAGETSDEKEDVEFAGDDRERTERRNGSGEADLRSEVERGNSMHVHDDAMQMMYAVVSGNHMKWSGGYVGLCDRRVAAGRLSQQLAVGGTGLEVRFLFRGILQSGEWSG
jgi:hypothetical protein